MTRFVYADANVRVDTPNSLYGDTPFTQKGGGGGRCGEQGDYIQVNSILLPLLFYVILFCLLKVTGQFLLNVRSSWVSRTLGPPGKKVEL